MLILRRGLPTCVGRILNRATVCTVLVLSCVGLSHAQDTSAATAASRPALDPAGAMPPDSRLYIELAHWGQQFDALMNLLQQAGVNDPMELVQGIVRARSASSQPAPGLATMLSPTMINEFRKLGDLSVTVDPATGGSEPPMVITLQLGRSEGLKPVLMVMLASASKGVEQHDGWAVYRMGDNLELAVLNDAVILARPAGAAAAAAERWRGGKSALAGQQAFVGGIKARREDGGLILYLNWPEFARGMKARPGESAADFERGERALAMTDAETLWSRVRVEPDGVSAQATVPFKTGQAPTYRLIRSQPLQREILRFVPADVLGCVATNVSNGAARVEALLELVALINGTQKDEAAKAQVREQLKQLEDRLGGEIDQMVENISTIAVAMMPPDIARLAREAGGGATTSAGNRGTGAPLSHEQIFQSSLFSIIQVKDAAVFDKLLEKLSGLLLASAGSQPADVEHRPATDGERRAYRINEHVKLHAAVVDRTYVFSLRPELVEAALAAKSGQIPNLIVGFNSQRVIEETPADASKLLLLRPDLLVNMMVGLRTVQMGYRSGRPMYPPVPNMKPVVVYTVEGDHSIELSVRVRDLPILIQTMLKMVPRPPMMPPPAK